MVSFIASMTFRKSSHFHGRTMFDNKNNNSCHLTIKKNFYWANQIHKLTLQSLNRSIYQKLLKIYYMIKTKIVYNIPGFLLKC